MRSSMPLALVVAALLAAACNTNNGTTVVRTTLPAPTGLIYQLDPSGTPGTPAGILLRWNDVVSTTLSSYNVYSRADTVSSTAYALRAITTSNTFHDNGVPSAQYFVTAVDISGGESPGSNVVTVDERLQLPRSAALTSVALDSAVFLNWSDSAAVVDPTRFSVYRVYSTGYVGTPPTGLCDTTWYLEGSTVSHEFVAAQLANGVTHCFATSAISIEGYESLWSPIIEDTPRPDARNVLVYSSADSAAKAGFQFYNPTTGALGVVGPSTTPGIDFRVDLNVSDSSLSFVPVFAGDSLQAVGVVGDVDSIFTAPTTGYLPNSLKAQVGMGYVFKRWQTSSAFYYAALRVTAVTRQYVIFDWSVQTAAGNPDLSRFHLLTLGGARIPAPAARASVRRPSGSRALRSQ